MLEQANNPRSAQQFIDSADRYFGGHNDKLVEAVGNGFDGLHF